MGRYYYFLFLFLLLISCDSIEQSIEEKYARKAASGVFEAIWNELDSNYVFFKEKRYDWDAYRNKYLKLIEKAHNDTACISLIDSLLYEMQEVSLLISVGGLPYRYCSYNDTIRMIDYKRTQINRNETYVWNDSIEDEPFDQFIVRDLYRKSDTCRLLPYLYCVPANRGYTTAQWLYKRERIQYLLEKRNVPELQGIILDLRANYNELIPEMMLEILRYFYPQGENIICYQSRRVVPENRYQLSTPEPYVLNGYGIFAFKPIIVLFDKRTSNEANVMSYIMTSRDKTVTVSAEQTRGGGGLRERKILEGEINSAIYYPAIHLNNEKYETFEKSLEPMVKISYSFDVEQENDANFKYGIILRFTDSYISTALACIDSINSGQKK